MIEEGALKQKARAKWIQLGDSNTRYFSDVMTERSQRKQIVELQAISGNRITDTESIQREIVDFYKSLIGTASQTLFAIDKMVMCNGAKLTQQQRIELCRDVTTEEIYEGLCSIGDDKAPGVDAYNAFFFKKAWPTVKDEVMEAAMDFFKSGKLYRAINCTAITLEPKVSKPKTVKEFSPIACCTVLYKLISKVLAARIQGVIGTVINEAQAGFIPGRKIADNIILAHELVNAYTRKNVSTRCMIKIDLQKAYDSVEWHYMKQVMEELGFPQLFISWVMECVQTVNYSIAVNGEPTKPFNAAK